MALTWKFSELGPLEGREWVGTEEVDSENDLNPGQFYKVALCSHPAWGLVSLASRKAEERAGLSHVVEKSVQF